MEGWGQFFCSQSRISTCYHRSVVPIKIYSLPHGESFIPLNLPLFLVDLWAKRWEITKEISMNCNGVVAYTYNVTLMAKYTCTWLHHPLELLTSTMFCHKPIQVSQDGFVLRLICVFLHCNLTIQLLLISLSSP